LITHEKKGINDAPSKDARTLYNNLIQAMLKLNSCTLQIKNIGKTQNKAAANTAAHVIQKQ